MGLFGKKDKKEGMNNLRVPELPELPRLPELPAMHEFSYEEEEEHLPQLPRFPNNTLGNKFSQNTIKEAISGKKEEEEVFDAEDFHKEENKGMMQKPLQKPSVMEDFSDYQLSQGSVSSMQKPLQKPAVREEFNDYQISKESVPTKTKEIPQNFAMRNYMTKKAEPVFIRIDKFEESMKIFQEIKVQISDIESFIKNTKEIKSKEEEELTSWETEIQGIKNQIEKVNQDIFSRIE